MNRIFCVILALAVAILTNVSDGAVFERDWKLPGDGLLTYDDVNKREWLDLSQSLLEQFPGSKLEQRYQSALLDLAPGGKFEGFEVAKRGDVITFATSAGIDTTTDDFVANEVPVSNLINLLGPTVTFSNGGTSSMGFLDEYFLPPSSRRLLGVFSVDPRSDQFVSRAFLSFTSSSLDSAGPSTIGMMLFKSVPEPTAATVIFSGLLACLCVAPRRRHFGEARQIQA